MSCGDPHGVDCREVLAKVYLYLDAEAGDADIHLIREHLDECAPCLRAFGLEQEVKALVARCCGSDLAPPALRVRVLARLQTVRVEIGQREFLAE